MYYQKSFILNPASSVPHRIFNTMTTSSCFHHRRSRGFSLVEVLIATTVLSIVALSIVYVQSFMSRQSVRIRERAFATEKAIQMMEELRSLVSGSEKIKINVLDDYDDGATYNAVLTTDRRITDPAHALSGNTGSAAGWRYLRRISVVKVPEEPFARKVYVRVYRNSLSSPGSPSETLAETVSILKTISSEYVPTQVLDVYIIAIENVPGWWSSLSTMRPMFDSVIQDLQTRNQGLMIRPHWVTRLSYGRDPYYTPYINDAAYTDDSPFPIPSVYFYPGLMHDSGGNDFNFYDASLIKSRINVDGTIRNADSYSLADRFNHGMRYPDEAAYYQVLTNRALLNGEPAPEKSLRMILEEMNSQPSSYRNILFINLHGELLPLPPVRNYSDAARDPANAPFVRIVTHPEKLQYGLSDTVRFRVYAYASDLNSYGFKGEYYDTTSSEASPHFVMSRMDGAVSFDWGGGSPDPGLDPDKFTVFWTGRITPKYSENYTFETVADGGVRVYLNGASPAIINDWNDPGIVSTNTASVMLAAGTQYTVQVQYCERGGDARIHFSWSSASQPKEAVRFEPVPSATIYLSTDTISRSRISVTKIVGDADIPYSRHEVADLVSGTTCQVSYPLEGGTLITLYDTPVLHPYNRGSGLSSTETLCGLEYIPCPVTNDFTTDLLASSATKNTARWIVSFSPGSFDARMHPVETRLGTNLTSGATWQFENLSKTYVWVGVEPPVTEKYQFMGDPRHCPYLDVKQDHRYNWYFRQINNTAGSYTGFTKTANGWGADHLEIDIPRFFQVYRQGLLNTQAVWTAMNGWSYYYYGLGGEFGSDQQPLPNGIPFLKVPWSATGETASVDVDEILPDGPADLDNSRIIARTDNSWYSRYWIGELYPDDQFVSGWQAGGNLPVGAGNFYRANYNVFSDFNRNRNTRTRTNGCSSFFNGIVSGGSGPMRHEGLSSAYGNITSMGLRLSSMFSLPLLTSIAANRPFTMDYGTGDLPTEWSDSVYSGLRTQLSIPAVAGTARTYYDSSYNAGTHDASSVIKMTSGSNTCYVSVSGLSTQADFGTMQMGKFVLATMLRTFLDGGVYADTQDKIAQLPLVDLVEPKISDTFDDPVAIHTEWNVSWKRWDGESYTEEYPSTYSEATPLVYSVKYSPDMGRNWYYCSDNASAQEGVKDAAHTASFTSFDWNVSGFSRGTYIIRIEGYREDIPFHYSYDQMQVYINR